MNQRGKKQKKGINDVGRKEIDNVKTIKVITSRDRHLKIKQNMFKK